MSVIPQHVLIDRVTRALERQGARLRKRDPNKRTSTDPGDFYILRPVGVGRLRIAQGTMAETYPGTLEALARELGVMDAHEHLAP